MTDHEVLTTLPDVIRLSAHAGQVLFYPRHTPPGLFVVVRGAVGRFAAGTLPEAACGDRLDAAAGAFAVPAPGELAGPARAGLRAATDVEILFVPRSVVLRGDDVARALAASGVPIVSLEDRPGRPRPATPARRAR